MKRPLHWIGAALPAILLAGPTFAASASPIGQWQVTTGEARYDVVSCGGGTLCAKLVWLRSDARTEENLALLNKYVVRGAQPSGGGTWSGAIKMNGNSYDGTMQLVSKNYMTLKGCSGILCQTYQFTRL